MFNFTYYIQISESFFIELSKHSTEAHSSSAEGIYSTANIRVASAAISSST